MSLLSSLVLSVWAADSRHVSHILLAVVGRRLLLGKRVCSISSNCTRIQLSGTDRKNSSHTFIKVYHYNTSTSVKVSRKPT